MSPDLEGVNGAEAFLAQALRIGLPLAMQFVLASLVLAILLDP